MFLGIFSKCVITVEELLPEKHGLNTGSQKVVGLNSAPPLINECKL